MNQMTMSNVRGVARNDKATKNYHQLCSSTELFKLFYLIVFCFMAHLCVCMVQSQRFFSALFPAAAGSCFQPADKQTSSDKPTVQYTTAPALKSRHRQRLAGEKKDI